MARPTQIQQAQLQQAAVSQDSKQRRTQQLNESDHFTQKLEQAKQSHCGTNKQTQRLEIEQTIEAASQYYGVDASLIRAVIRQESGYQPDVTSCAGAHGLMQLMPGTARELGVTDSSNIQQNVFGGTRYLRQMLDRYDGDMVKALAAYNAGPGNVDKYGGVPPFEETQKYVTAVLSHRREYQANGASRQAADLLAMAQFNQAFTELAMASSFVNNTSLSLETSSHDGPSHDNEQRPLPKRPLLV